MNACRILERLQKAELSEPDIWFRQDYRQAYMCVSLVEKGDPQPFIESSYRIYGTHPDQVWWKIMENRKARLGKEFLDWYDAEGSNRKPDLPKKKPAIYIDEQAERATNERLGALLNFPKWRVQHADVIEAGKQKGTLYEMPARTEASTFADLACVRAF